MSKKYYSRKDNLKRSKKRRISDVRSYWVGVGLALGLASNGKVTQYVDKARCSSSMKQGFHKELSSALSDTPSNKAKLFK